MALTWAHAGIEVYITENLTIELRMNKAVLFDVSDSMADAIGSALSSAATDLKKRRDVVFGARDLKQIWPNFIEDHDVEECETISEFLHRLAERLDIS